MRLDFSKSCVKHRSRAHLLSSDIFFVGSIITPPDPDGCASTLLGDDLDLIFTDIIGVERLAVATGPHESRYRSA